MKKIKARGTNLIVLPFSNSENPTSEGGIEIAETEIERATIIVVGDELKEIYKPGDTILMPKGTKGTTIGYNGKAHIFIDGKPVNSGGNVYAIETNEVVPKDKGDSL